MLFFASFVLLNCLVGPDIPKGSYDLTHLSLGVENIRYSLTNVLLAGFSLRSATRLIWIGPTGILSLQDISGKVSNVFVSSRLFGIGQNRRLFLPIVGQQQSSSGPRDLVLLSFSVHSWTTVFTQWHRTNAVSSGLNPNDAQKVTQRRKKESGRKKTTIRGCSVGGLRVAKAPSVTILRSDISNEPFLELSCSSCRYRKVCYAKDRK
jgi:hypothetical protein